MQFLSPLSLSLFLHLTFFLTDVAHAFQINHANKSFHVFALSAADKANWLSNLQKHIAKVSQSGVHCNHGDVIQCVL